MDEVIAQVDYAHLGAHPGAAQVLERPPRNRCLT